MKEFYYEIQIDDEVFSDEEMVSLVPTKNTLININRPDVDDEFEFIDKFDKDLEHL